MKIKLKFAIVLSTLLTILTCSLALSGVSGTIIDGRTMVPLRGVFESLGFTVDWDPEKEEARMSDGTHNIAMSANLNFFNADGKIIKPAVPQQIINGSLYLPLSAIGDAIGANTSWDIKTKIAHISYNGKDIYVNCGSSASSEKKTSTTNSTPSTKPSDTLKKITSIDELTTFVLNNASVFTSFAEENIRAGNPGVSILGYHTLKYPYTATFRDSTVVPSQSLKGMAVNGDYYMVGIKGYVTSQLSNGMYKEAPYMAEVLFHISEDNLPVDLQFSFAFFSE